MRTVRHWLHILIVILTGGLWLPGYVLIIATNEIHNRGYRAGKAAGRVEKSNEIEDARSLFAGLKPRFDIRQNLGQKPLGCRSTMDSTFSIDGEQVWFEKPKEEPTFEPAPPGQVTRINRFAELAQRARTVGLVTSERAEYLELRRELGQ